MKRIFLLLTSVSFLLTGCFETTEEITINDDGTGTVSTTNDLSAVISIAKNMGGGGEELEKLTSQKMDTTISLAAGVDSIPDLSAEEKDLLRKGTMQVKMDGQAEKFFTKLNFSFKSLDQVAAFNKLSGKLMGKRMKDMASGSAAGMPEDMPEVTSFADYYDLKFEKGEIKRSLNKDKFAKAESDEYLKGLREAGGMGIPVTATYIYNLPRPVEKAEGKNVTVSEDKKKVTIKVDINDFFDHPESLEFKIKY